MSAPVPIGRFGASGRPRALLGVLGGMGPEATLDFLAKVLAHTPAARDQDHLPVLTFSASQAPDRSAAILGQGESPLPAMVYALEVLVAGGASCVVIPCNTAHFWFDDLKSIAPVNMIHIVDAVVEEFDRIGLVVGKVGLLATTGTLRGRIYEKRLADHGMNLVSPNNQDAIMEAIGLIKSGRSEAAVPLLAREAEALLDAGCEALVLGCTEIPLVLDRLPPHVRAASVDATDALARASLCSIAKDQ